VSRGRLCKKCSTAYNGVLLDPAARLLHPLRRSGPKGSGQFERVSWEAAIEEVAERFSAVPPASILNAHYTGTFALLGYAFPLRFFNRLGATEIDPDTICNNAGHVALDYLYGSSLDGFDPRTAQDSAAILVWGANPSASAPHQHDHWLPEAPGQVIVVDPVRTPTAAAADLHLAPFPGSDAALAFALLHVIVREGLSDAALLAEHALGWEELESRVAECTPAWGETVTGVPSEQIELAARVYGEGPSLLWIGQGFQRQPRGGNAVRAVGLLPVASGNLGKPGTGLLYLNGTGSRRIDDDYLAGTTLARGAAPEPISHMDLAGVLEDPSRAQALCCWNINIAASNPEQARLRRALAREDLFTVVVDMFATDTTDHADIVLPAATFLEQDDLVASYFHLSLGAQVKAIEPLGESLPNTEIFRRLAGAMGFEDSALFESDEEVISHVLEPTGVSFAELASRGTVWLDPEPVIQWADLCFPTPSGRVEIASERAEAAGHPRLPEPHADPRPAAGSLRLLSPASAWLLNDSFANDPKLTWRLGAATVTMHPEDAAACGVGEGSQAVLETSTGRLTLTVALSDDLPRGVVYSPKGRWPKREPGGANVNVLNPGIESDMGRSTTVHGVEVAVSPA
ncbi:MAG TPA: molybdopterin-dependent oxidoreductase, partial [Solirubrobacteraceae bacterium]|nr:molybdopterin-dependent oxidoreductase [Solirubrobacteraceae bacterium]